MSVNSEFLPPVQSPEDFESLCLDLFREIWEDPNAQKVGRSGQEQKGVDVAGRHAGRQVGVQCKQKDALQRKRLTAAVLLEEVARLWLPRGGWSTNVVMVAAGRSWRSWKSACWGLCHGVEFCPL